LDQLFHPLDTTYKIQSSDLSETIEALLGACFLANGYLHCEKPVLEILEFQKVFTLKSEVENKSLVGIPNFKGRLLELYQQNNKGRKDKEPLPILEPKDVGNIYNHQFQFEGILRFNDKDYCVKTDIFTNKKDAEQQAAQKLLESLIDEKDNKQGMPMNIKNGVSLSLYNILNKLEPKSEIQSVVQLMSLPSVLSFSSEYKGSTENEHAGSPEIINLDSNNQETLLIWAQRKAKKDPFSMLWLLSARLKEIKVKAWSCTIPNRELTILCVQLGDIVEFGLGNAISKTQAKKQAGQSIIDKLHVFEWIQQHYPNQRI
jgi:dsRNA-specific ribonuclease